MVLLKESLQGKGPIYVFGNAGTEMRRIEADTLAGAIEAQHAT
ncbi:MAG: hypothetical protein ACTSX8_07275 [Alphaproteobacteria bacterium]